MSHLDLVGRFPSVASPSSKHQHKQHKHQYLWAASCTSTSTLVQHCNTLELMDTKWAGHCGHCGNVKQWPPNMWIFRLIEVTTLQWWATADDGGTPIGDRSTVDGGHRCDRRCPLNVTHQRWTLSSQWASTLADTPVNGDTRTGGHLALRDTRKSQGAFRFSSANLSHGKSSSPIKLHIQTNN